jgi:hypothetical protein
MGLDLGEVAKQLPANCRGPSCVTTNGTSATIEDAVDAAAQLRDPFAYNDSFTPEADIRPMAFLTQTRPHFAVQDFRPLNALEACRDVSISPIDHFVARSLRTQTWRARYNHSKFLYLVIQVVPGSLCNGPGRAIRIYSHYRG